MVVAGVRREGGRRWLVVLQTSNRVLDMGLVYLLSCLRGIVYHAANLSSQRRFANPERLAQQPPRTRVSAKQIDIPNRKHD